MSRFRRRSRVNISDLLSRGYFPAELQPPFKTSTFATACTLSLPPEFTNGSNWTRSAAHSYARPGSLRRKLTIPNPVNYYRLSNVLTSVWETDIQTQFDKSTHSWSRLIPSSGRAIRSQHHWRDLPKARAQIRSTSRYILTTDISKFYGSIYTHAIPWAFHGKAAAKAAMHDRTLLGNRIDKCVREGQEGQTIGIPIGPDTSFIIAECLLSSLDQTIELEFKNGFRHVDDFEFGFSTYSEADNALAVLQGILSDFELSLNSAKTRIIQLPDDLEKRWVRDISLFDLKLNLPLSKDRLFNYFSIVFEQAKDYPTDSVISFALSKIGVAKHLNYWKEFENLLYQCIRIDVTALSKVLEILVAQTLLGRELQAEKLQEVLSRTIVENAPLGHGSEVGWAIWGSMLFDLSLDSHSINSLKQMNDPFVALLALHARSLNLIPSSESFPLWEAEMKIESLESEQWVLAYEASIKGWQPSVGGLDHISAHPCFSFLRANNVSFYDINTLQMAKNSGLPDSTLNRHLIASSMGISMAII